MKYNTSNKTENGIYTDKSQKFKYGNSNVGLKWDFKKLH